MLTLCYHIFHKSIYLLTYPHFPQITHKIYIKSFKSGLIYLNSVKHFKTTEHQSELLDLGKAGAACQVKPGLSNFINILQIVFTILVNVDATIGI